eukprot:178339_1
MSYFSSLLIFCLVIVSICRATDKCLAFSGGGIRASMGAYFTMRRLEDDKKLGKIKCISAISGGSWGFIMWLYEDKPGSVSQNIIDWIYQNDMAEWGPQGPIEVTGEGSWFEKWTLQIQRFILDMTSLKGKHRNT